MNDPTYTSPTYKRMDPRKWHFEVGIDGRIVEARCVVCGKSAYWHPLDGNGHPAECEKPHVHRWKVASPDGGRWVDAVCDCGASRAYLAAGPAIDGKLAYNGKGLAGSYDPAR